MNEQMRTDMVQDPVRREHAYTQSIHAAPDEVFALLCPVREMDWAPGWAPHRVISGSGVAEKDCVFQTAGEGGSGPATWVITEHRPGDHHVEMIKVIPEHSVMRLEASLEDDGAGGTLATITYRFTALGLQGEQFLAERTADWYRRFMRSWEAAMNHYLATGRMIEAEA
jgi:hypothetical protein